MLVFEPILKIRGGFDPGSYSALTWEQLSNTSSDDITIFVFDSGAILRPFLAMLFVIIPGKTLKKGERKKVQFFIIIVGSTTTWTKKKFVKKGCGFGFPSYVIISRLQLIFSCYAIRNNTYEVASLESYNNFVLLLLSTYIGILFTPFKRFLLLQDSTTTALQDLPKQCFLLKILVKTVLIQSWTSLS